VPRHPGNRLAVCPAVPQSGSLADGVIGAPQGPGSPLRPTPKSSPSPPYSSPPRRYVDPLSEVVVSWVVFVNSAPWPRRCSRCSSATDSQSLFHLATTVNRRRLSREPSGTWRVGAVIVGVTGAGSRSTSPPNRTVPAGVRSPPRRSPLHYLKS